MQEAPGKFAALLRRFDPTDLAEKVIVSRQTVYRWQDGSRLPRRRMLRVISVATGIALDDLTAALRADRLAKRDSS